MLLQSLKDYASTLTLPPPMYDTRPVRYVVDLDARGKLRGVVDTATAGKGREARGVAMICPTIARTSAPRANLLVDNAEYALGLARGEAKPQQVLTRHRLFREVVAAAHLVTSEPDLAAVLAFLDGLPRAPFPAPADFDPAANVTFRVEGRFPFDIPSVQAYWARVNGATPTADAEVGDILECMVCGQLRPAMRRLPFKHKNIPGGQTAGTALISANASAFESYGLEESLIAPVCFGCAEGFSKGLNALIDGATTHLRRDPLLYVFWARESAFSPLSLLEQAEPDEVKQLLRAADTARTGNVAAVDAADFYAISLGGSGGRVAVRDWLNVTVGDVKAHLARFFRLQLIADPERPTEPMPFPVWRLARSTVRDQRKDEPSPTVSRALYRMALAGGPAPKGVLFAVVRRFRAEQFSAAREVNRARVALVKLVLLSQPDSPWKEDSMVGLDRGERHPAYLCGRLLAVLEAVQSDALGNVNATVVDRFYGSASATPIAVFGRLVRGAQPHLARLRRDRPGAFVARQNELQEILAGLPGDRGDPAFPTALTLEEQGLFALGYYHQRAERFTRHDAQSTTATTVSTQTSLS